MNGGDQEWGCCSELGCKNGGWCGIHKLQLQQTEPSFASMAKGGNWELGKPKACCRGPLDELME